MIIVQEEGELVYAVVMHDKRVVYAIDMMTEKGSDGRVFLQTPRFDQGLAPRYKIDDEGIISLSDEAKKKELLTS